MTRFRDDDSKIKDKRMTDAFTEGFREGQAVAENPVMWRLSVETDGTVIYREEFDVGVSALQKAATYLDTPGTTVTIEVRQTPVDAEEQVKELEDGVEDAEVLEGAEIEPRQREEG